MTLPKHTPTINNGLILIDEETLKSLLSEAVTNAIADQLSEFKEPEDTLLTTKDLC